MVSRAGTRRCYISLLCVGGVGVKKQRKISSESECFVRLRKICPSSRTPPSPPTSRRICSEKETFLRDERFRCVTVHTTQKLFFIHKGKKSTFTFTKEKAHVRRKRKRATPPNTVTQTVHHERAFERVFFAKENARERDALAPQSKSLKKRQILPFFHEKK